jgi:predicted ester cyclase
MSAEENKALALRLFDEAINQRNYAVLDDIISAAMVVDPGLPRGPKGMVAVVEWLHSVFASLLYTVEDLVAEEDKVAVRLRGRGTQVNEYISIPATGTSVTFNEMIFLRVADHQITHWWLVADQLDILRQINPSPVSLHYSPGANAPTRLPTPPAGHASTSPARRGWWPRNRK